MGYAIGQYVCYTDREQRSNNCKKCSNSFFAISSQHVTMMNTYSSMDAAISASVLEIFVTKSIGTLYIDPVWNVIWLILLYRFCPVILL